jgi:hypothetical protein
MVHLEAIRSAAVVLLAAGVAGVAVERAPAQGRGGRPGFVRPERETGAEHGWLNDYAEARDLARKTGKPLMVVFRCVP